MTKFEHLPNELVLDIFTYLDSYDLFVSLFNLNIRLNTLIYAQPLSINLGNSLSKYLLDRYYQSVLSPARNQIHTLKLSDTYERMSNFLKNDNQIQIDFETRKFILSQVKSLILCNPKTTSLNRVLKYVSNIEHICISIGQQTQSTSNYQGLFKSLFKMKSLKRLCLDLYDALIIDDDIDASISLTDMTLTSCYIQDLAQLLRRMPNIRKLHITCYNRRNSLTNDDDNFDYSLIDGLGDYVPFLTDLKLKVMFISFEKIEVFLQQLSQLTKLTFSSITLEKYSNGLTWERIINNYLPNLEKFSLFLDETYIFEDTLVDLNEIIQSFNSSFWHRWPVVIEYYVEATDKKCLILYTLPIQESNLRTYLYGLEIRKNIDEYNQNIEKSYYNKLNQLNFIFHENPSSRNLLPTRIYSNLETFTFSFELINPTSYEIDSILINFQQVFSTSVLSKIERIYFYDRIYPTNFVSKLLNLLPNIVALHIPASSLHLSTTLPLLVTLTIDFNSTIECYSTDILRQVATHFPDIHLLYFESVHSQDIYILLSYCLRKFSHLSYLNIKFDQTNSHIDRQTFILWFNDYKQLNGLSDNVQVEFNDHNNILDISW
ncbi:unnamed protein product [Rotaria sordida]|uniref:F-box domain-containing protein n=1 Tax=Rotaria sordida TaxID=392033 RepID=A0A815TBB6_9BILA|nr:unnamed protein product [Rotaria sordida]CAF1503006.1 unnamed protein product [Rotaria sordida]